MYWNLTREREEKKSKYGNSWTKRIVEQDCDSSSSKELVNSSFELLDHFMGSGTGPPDQVMGSGTGPPDQVTGSGTDRPVLES